MTEESEKMMLLLKQLAVLRESQTIPKGPAATRVSPTVLAKKRKEITRAMKRLARATKNKHPKD